MARVNGDGVGIALLIFDIDHFEAVVIKGQRPCRRGQCAAPDRGPRGRQQCAASILLARLGGEEFAVVMPETSSAVAAVVADRLRLAVASEPFVLGPDGERLPITVSIGATTTIAGGEDRDQLLKRADDALYEAKSAGRNRVVAHPAKFGRPVNSRPRRPAQVGW